MPEVSYHHYSLIFNPNEVEHRFKDVRFVLVAGCSQRVEAQANYLVEKLFDGVKYARYPVERLTKPRSRFTLFKLGPCLLSNHGMGCASMSIALHELFLMCQTANVIKKITVLRFGTCGGIGVPAGTICITNRALDPLFQDFVELKICMQLVKRPCVMDASTVDTFAKLCKEHLNHDELGNYEVRFGATIATNDFYEEQGRTNGAICEHTIADKMKFLERAREIGVINMEMECNHLAAMCHKLNVSFGVVDVALADRLSNDKVELSAEQMALFERRLFWLNSVFIRHKLFGDA